MDQLEEVKKIIRSLLVSAPVKVTVSSLNKDFHSLEGRYIPHRELGYNSLQHLLYSIPDVLRVKGSSLESEVTLVITDKVAHVSDMVMKQKKPSKGKNARAGRKSIIREYPSSSPFSGQPVSNHRNDLVEVVDKYNKCVENPTSYLLKNCNGLSILPKNKLEKHIQSSKSSSNYVIKTGNSNSKENSSTSLQHDNIDNQELFPKEYSDRCDRVPSLLKHMPHNIPDEISISENRNSGTQSKFEKLKLRYRNKNVSNIEAETQKSTTTLIDDISLALDDGIISIENENSVKVPLEIQNNLKKLIKCHPSGIRCTDLPVLYKKKFFQNLQYQAYGFDRLISLCIHLEHIFCCEQESDCDFRLYDVENPQLRKDPIKENSCEIPQWNIKVNTVDISLIKAVKSKDWEIHVDMIPEESLKLGDVVETNSLNEYVIGETFKIVISEMYNPSKFWIYKNDGHLNGLMNSMQSFYRENKANYIIPEFLLDVGLYCVVYTLKEFQRAVIIDLLQKVGGYVKVYLIDYGTLTNLPADKIWFLFKEFCSLPCQAVETNLAGIEPKEGIWSKQSILRFKDMVASKHIFAKVIDKKEDILSIHIAVSSMPLQTLNDLLVQEGYAIYISNCEIQNASTNDTRTIIGEKNPRKKLIERIRMKNQIKENQ